MNSGIPFYTINNNPVYASNDSCLVNMSSGSKCSIAWQVNATGNVNTTWTFYAIMNSLTFPSYVNSNSSSIVNITIIPNYAPIVESVFITPYEPLYSNNLTCNFNITDQNIGDNLAATVNWYKEGILIYTDYLGVTDGATTTTTLDSSYLTVGDNWLCAVTPYDTDSSGLELNSSSVLILSTIPPKISNVECLRNNSVWIPCTSISYNQIIGKVRAMCNASDGYVVNATFSLKNIDDANTFFTGLTTDNSTGYWIFDNTDLLVIDSGIFNLSVNCTDSNSTIGSNITSWLVPWGNLTATLISPNVSMNVTSKRFFNFSSRVTCSGGECGYINVTLDPYREYFDSFEDDTDGWTHVAAIGGIDEWHRSTESAKFGVYSWKHGRSDEGNYSTPPGSILTTQTYDIRSYISNSTVVTFYHYLNSENQWDGGKIEYSLNNTAWVKVPAGLFINGSYNGVFSLNSGAPANGFVDGEAIWTNNVGSQSNFSLVRINISTLRGENITFRFRFGGDDNTAGEGWYIDGFNITAWDYNITKGAVSMNRSVLPFYTTTQNPATYLNFSCLANMRSGDSCNTTWQVNASDTKGTYSFFVEYNSVNYTSRVIDKNTTTINLTIILNTAPTVSSVTITPEYAVVGQNLFCSFIVFDSSPLDFLNANVTWYRNNTRIFSSIVNVTYNVSYSHTLGAGNLSSGDTWHCGVRPYDEQAYGNQLNSTNKTVLIGIPPKLNSIYCLRNYTTWVNCTTLGFGDVLSGVRVNCTNSNASITNASIVFTNTPDSKTFFNITTVINSSNWWIYYNNITIFDSGQFVISASCNNNNSVSDRGNVSKTIPWGRLLGRLVYPNSNTIVEYNDFFSFTANVSCTGGECGNISALLDPGFPLGSPTNGTADSGLLVDISGTDEEGGSYLNTQTNDTTYYIAGESGWADANSLIELAFNLSSLSINANKNVTTINLTMSYCHSGDAIATIQASGCNGNAPIEKTIDSPQDVMIYNTYTDSWDSIGVLNYSNNENLVWSNFGVTGTNLSKYINSSGFVRTRIEMLTAGVSNTNQAFIAVNYVLLGLTYEYVKGGAPIPTVIGALPFYTNNSNPYTVTNYSCLGNMSSFTSGCQVTWTVNATGRPDTSHEFWVIYNSSNYPNYIYENSTTHIFITIQNSTGVPPVVNLNSPINNFATSSSNILLNCSATDNRGLIALVLYDNFYGFFVEDTTNAISGTSNSTTFNVTVSDGIYVWNCLAIDTDSNERFATSNRTVIIDHVPPNIILNAPAFGDNISSSTVRLNFTAIDATDTVLSCNITVDSIIVDSNFGVTNGTNVSRNIAGFTQGDHYWNVTCSDRAGNYNVSETRLLTMLNTPPVVVLQTTDNYMTNLNEIDLFYFADDNRNVSQADLYLNGVFNQTEFDVLTGSTNGFSLSDLSEGRYNWTVNVTDDGGLTAQAVYRRFVIDLTNPGLTLNYPPTNHITNTSSVIFNFTSTDNYDSIMACKITVNGVDLATGINANNGSLTSRSVSGIRDGLNYWNITCLDDAGNYNVSETRMLNVTAPPTVTLNTPSDTYSQKLVNITLYYTPTDNNNNITNCSLYLNYVRNQTNSSITSGVQNNFRLSNLIDGGYNWSVTCFDNSNTSGSSSTRIFYIDTTLPTITLNKPSQLETVYGGVVNFNWTAYDNIDPALTCNLTIDGLVNKTNIASPNGQPTNVSVAIAVEGNHTWSISCRDDSNNFNTSITQDFTTINAPTVTLVVPTSNYYFNNGSDINFTFIPSSSNILINATLYINGVANQTINSPVSDIAHSFYVNFTNNGLYNWSVRIIDDIGLNGTSLVRFFTIDNIDPVVNIMTPINGQTIITNNVTFRFNLSENLVAAVLCNISVSETLEWSNISASNGTTITRYKVLPDGNYNWSVTCFDNSGNSNNYILTNFTVLAPPNVTLNNPVLNYRTILTNITFNYTPRDDIGIDSCTLVINDIDNQSSSSITKNIPNYFNLTNINEGVYNWTVRCIDSAPDLNSHTPVSRNLTIDLSPPIITMLYPGDGDSINTNTVQFNWTVADYPINVACMLFVDGIYNRTVTQLSGTYFTPTVTNFTFGSHNWTLNCSDDLNNSQFSVLRSFIINNADLYVDSSRLVFNNTNPDENQTINISVNVSNIGGVPVTNAFVEFYDGNPDLGGVVIGNMTRNVNVNSSAIYSVLWNISTGYHTIFVFVDPTNVISELSEFNNNISKNISLLQSIIISPENISSFIDPNVSITFKLKDYTSGAINYSIFVDNILNGQNGSVIDNISENINITLNQGTRSIKIEALDYLGRKKNSTAIFVTVDYTPPNATIVTLNNTWFNYSTPAISITARDNVDTNINYTLYVDDVVNILGNLSNGSTISVNLSSLTEGYHQIIMEAYDNLNNSANSTPKYIYVDLTNPNIVLNSPVSGANITSRTVILNYSVNDTLSTTLFCNITLDGTIISTQSVGNGSSSTYTVNNLLEGTHYWNVTCRDQALNRNISLTNSFNIYIPPVITLVAPTNNQWSNNESNIFLFNVSDETGLYNCSIIIDGAITQTKDNSQLINNATNNFTLSSMTSGNYSWNILCYDNTTYNSYNSTLNRTFYVDLVLPETNISTMNNTWFNVGNPQIRFNITDNMDNSLDYIIYVNDAPNVVGAISNASMTSVNLISLVNGTFVVLIEALDNAGNRKNSTPITIYVDSIRPSINLTNPLNDSNVTTDVLDMNFTVYDNMAFTALCNLTLDNYLIASNLSVNTNENQNVTISGLLGGYHYWNVTCIDQALNRNTSPTYVFYVVMPDLYINASNILFSKDNPIENETINITAIIQNIGLNDVSNFTIEMRVNSISGTIIGSENISLAVNESYYFNSTYTLPLGNTAFYVLVDVPLFSNGTIKEYNESNNNASRIVHVGLWEYITGDTNDRLAMDDSNNQTIYDWLVSNSSGSKIFATDIDSNINWRNLHALGMNISNQSSPIDFYSLDILLNSTNFTDSINKTYTLNGAPVEYANYTLFARVVNNIPIVNSTNNSNFKTGILWDYGDGGTRYLGTQDIVFVSSLNKNMQGYNSTVDYELRIPATLRSYKPGQNLVVFYVEIN
ncbi:MAG: CARDB domain-containing protein [Candidatus Woesearchaeota archaeon]